MRIDIFTGKRIDLDILKYPDTKGNPQATGVIAELIAGYTISMYGK